MMDKHTLSSEKDRERERKKEKKREKERKKNSIRRRKKIDSLSVDVFWKKKKREE